MSNQTYRNGVLHTATDEEEAELARKGIAWESGLATRALSVILSNRQSEYPPMQDYLDGIVKGDTEQVDRYIADCQAVKARYPKPQ